LIEDRICMIALRQHDPCIAGITGALVAEAACVGADKNAALLDRGPGEEPAMRVRDGSVSLLGRQVIEGGAEFPTP
jgi:hypothetical protein